MNSNHDLESINSIMIRINTNFIDLNKWLWNNIITRANCIKEFVVPCAKINVCLAITTIIVLLTSFEQCLQSDTMNE